MAFEFKKAERKAAKLRLALCSPAGGGKTFSALLIAKGLGGNIAMIDTEHGSGSLYANNTGMPEYSVLELDPPFSPKRYIEAIEAAENAGFTTIIIDSLTHAWSGEGGVLEMHDNATKASRSGNSFDSWRTVTPEHNRLVDAILTSKCHIIATMRTKTEYTQSQDEKGKTIIKKVGTAPVQREGVDYEFTVVLDLSTSDHMATASKDRTSLFDGQVFKPSEDTGKQLLSWLNSGKAIPDSEWDKLKMKDEPQKATTEKAIVIGSDNWILGKIKELNISEDGLKKYITDNLRVQIEDGDIMVTISQLTPEKRMELVKTINAKEKALKTSIAS